MNYNKILGRYLIARSWTSILIAHFKALNNSGVLITGFGYIIMGYLIEAVK